MMEKLGIDICAAVIHHFRQTRFNHSFTGRRCYKGYFRTADSVGMVALANRDMPLTAKTIRESLKPLPFSLEG